MKEVSDNHLDKLWSEIIRLVFKGTCAKCGKRGTDPHHIVYRRHKAFRWHALNGVFLCRECHMWAHQNPKKFEKWVRNHLKVQAEYVLEGFNEHNEVRHRLVYLDSLQKIKKHLRKNIVGGGGE